MRGIQASPITWTLALTIDELLMLLENTLEMLGKKIVTVLGFSPHNEP